MNGEVGEDIITVQSMPTATVDHHHHRYLLTCAPSLLLQGLAKGAKGMVGLGRNRISLPSQLAGAFGSNRKFSICLPPSTSPKGAMFFDTSPLIRTSSYNVIQRKGSFPNTLLAEVSKSLVYTPLITKGAVSTKEDLADEYYIGVKSIRINGRELAINKALLSINEDDGSGGTKLSTTAPYTTLETSVFDTVTKAFTQVATSMFNMTREAAIAPFEFCFSSENIGKAEFGSVVPIIDLVLQSNMVKWRIHGANSMVQVSDKVMCLGFLNGGLDVRDSIVLGGYQLENNLLEFDLASSRMGFSSLLNRGIECSNFDLLGDTF
ncbi:Basic 7s globulin [Thalictrum thalictroides]|uniref:Basic 7s globulin n=1 Tax=Thalictrum thalictroides TaxID=46969 RepID=A0A7J6WS62_THATH|nr:Basic 7s globulin [Thalictrum thalictroides]